MRRTRRRLQPSRAEFGHSSAPSPWLAPRPSATCLRAPHKHHHHASPATRPCATRPFTATEHAGPTPAGSRGGGRGVVGEEGRKTRLRRGANAALCDEGRDEAGGGNVKGIVERRALLRAQQHLHHASPRRLALLRSHAPRVMTNKLRAPAKFGYALFYQTAGRFRAIGPSSLLCGQAPPPNPLHSAFSFVSFEKNEIT